MCHHMAPLAYAELADAYKGELADALLESRREKMANLTTVLVLLFGTATGLLSAIKDLDLQNSWAATAVIAASIAIGSTMVGLASAISFQVLARKIRKGHAKKFVTGTPLVAWLSNFAMLGVAISCVSLSICLACSVYVRYNYHLFATWAAGILFAALLLCLVVMCMYFQIQKDPKIQEDMHSAAHSINAAQRRWWLQPLDNIVMDKAEMDTRVEAFWKEREKQDREADARNCAVQGGNGRDGGGGNDGGERGAGSGRAPATSAAPAATGAPAVLL